VKYAYKTDVSVDSLPVSPETLKQAQKRVVYRNFSKNKNGS